MYAMNTIESLARSRRERLLIEAHRARLASPLGQHFGLRTKLARAVREIGLAFLILGDALAERPSVT